MTVKLLRAYFANSNTDWIRLKNELGRNNPFEDPIEHETTSEEMVEMKRKISNTETLDIYEKIPFIEKGPTSSENEAYVGKGW